MSVQATLGRRTVDPARAVVLDAHGSVAFGVLPRRRGPGLVPVAVEQVGVCGTDLAVVAGVHRVERPRVLGHELVGRTLEATDRLPAGTRVLVDPSVSCGVCDRCRSGKPHLCRQGGLMGRDVDGGLAEWVEVEPERLHPVPPDLDADDAAVLQVLGTVVHAQRMVPLFPGGTAAVVGLGVSGLLHLQLLRARGCRP